MTFRTVSYSALAAALLLSLGSATAFAAIAAPAPERIADQRAFSLTLDQNSVKRMTTAAGQDSARSVEVARIKTADASFIKVHFDYILLPAGLSIEVSSPDGGESYRYGGVDSDGFTVDKGMGQNGITSYSAMSISGPSAVVRLVGTAREAWGPQHGVKVSQYLEGYPEDMLPQLRADGLLNAHPESVCGSNDQRPVQCYVSSEPKAFDRARPVAYAVLNNGSVCTAWRVGAGDKMFTNNHCVSTDSGVAATEMWFNRQATTCGGSTSAPIVKVPGNHLLKTSQPLDYTLFSIKNPENITQFGYLGLDIAAPRNGDQIFIAGHPAARPKELSITSDTDGGSYCKVTGSDSVNANYNCDTEGGNSGSPVMLRANGKATFLHHTGSCDASGGYNSGVRFDRIWPEVSSFFNNQVPSGDDSTPPPASDGVCLFADSDYRGAAQCYTADVAFVGAAFNDKASSVRIPAGYEANLFDNSNYGGSSLKLTGNSTYVGAAFNDITSSMRVTRTAPPADAVCVFQDDNYVGPSKCFSADTAYVGSDWNDRLSSVKVAAGYKAVLYSDRDYGGNSLELGANATSLPADWNDKASSLRLLRK